MSPELLSADQVRQLLDVDKSTVYRMAADGRLPAVKIGRQWRFRERQVRRLLQTGVPATTQSVVSVPVHGTGAALPLSWDLLSEVSDLVAKSLGVMMVVTDMEGSPVVPVANPCPWFAAHIEDEGSVEECIADWRAMADELDFEPRFRLGRHGFLCARAFVRSGPELVGMVLVGGIAPPDAGQDSGLYQLDESAKRHVLELLPQVASSLSRLAGHRIRRIDASPPPERARLTAR